MPMHDLYRHYGTQSRWEKYDVSSSPLVDVTDVWVDSDGRLLPALVQSRTMSSIDIDGWLDEPSQQCFSSGAYTRAVRLVWVGQDDRTKHSSPSTKALERLTEAWSLKDALNYARSCFAGVSEMTAEDGSRVYTAAYHPKLAVAWRCSNDGTSAIIFAEGEERTELRRILSSEWSTASTASPMFPALLCSLVLAQGLDSTLEDIKAAVREVEARTGHHRFASRHQTRPAAGELGHLSAQMSGCAAKLANGTRKMKVVEAINEFISRESARDHHGAGGETADKHFPASHMAILRHRVQMQAVDTAYVQQRVQIQLTALFHLIAQQDNAIAFDAAKATRSIAASSLDDSSSMKMLALVAMFFLPGSFVATLFATPLFAWDDASTRGGIGVATRPQFALFWAITAPLTILVFIMYSVWMCVQRRRVQGTARNIIPPETA